ncbi:MAG: hypothetical protein JW794_01275 [Candidatus Cloacimonetes bacterium]|nr:hypothetical protein [Candidatus Cloacimonadota bacterium]
MTKKILPFLVFTIILFAGCADFLEPIIYPGELIIKAIIPTNGFARDVFVSEEFIFIAEDQAGFSIYDKATDSLLVQYYGNIENARLIQAIDDINQVFVYDRYGSPAAIMVYDYTDPKNPVELPPVTGQTASIEDLKCVLRADNSVDVLWTHANSYQYGNYNNIWLGSYAYDFPNAIEGFDIRDTLLFVSGEQRGLYITNRNNGTIISEVNTPGTAVDVKVYENYAYVADKEYGISVIDISDITQPELVFNYDTSGYAQRLDVDGDFLILASGGGGVYLFDISNREHPEFSDRWDDSDIGYTYDVEFYDGEVFVSTREGVYRMSIVLKN